MTINSLRTRRDEILSVASRHGAMNVRVFGSTVRDEAGSASDVDFLVDFHSNRSLLDQAGLQIDLQAILQVPVDVATVAGLKPRIRELVLREAVAL
jgi:hypothetical protein